MNERPRAAGGFFLMVAILIGFAWGVWQGVPLLGALIGTCVGAVVAVTTWLVDRRRD